MFFTRRRRAILIALDTFARSVRRRCNRGLTRTKKPPRPAKTAAPPAAPPATTAATPASPLAAPQATLPAAPPTALSDVPPAVVVHDDDYDDTEELQELDHTCKQLQEKLRIRGNNLDYILRRLDNIIERRYQLHITERILFRCRDYRYQIEFTRDWLTSLQQTLEKSQREIDGMLLACFTSLTYLCT